MIAFQERKPEEIAITVPSRAEYVGWARKFVERIARDGGLNPGAVEDVKLAVGEACNNAVLHGSPQGGGNMVSVQCWLESGALTVEVKDQGPGFRLPRQRILPPMALSEGGRGLVLIRMLMDEVSYHNSPSGGTLRMVKRMEA